MSARGPKSSSCIRLIRPYSFPWSEKGYDTSYIRCFGTRRSQCQATERLREFTGTRFSCPEAPTASLCPSVQRLHFMKVASQVSLAMCRWWLSEPGSPRSSFQVHPVLTLVRQRAAWKPLQHVRTHARHQNRRWIVHPWGSFLILAKLVHRQTPHIFSIHWTISRGQANCCLEVMPTYPLSIRYNRTNMWWNYDKIAFYWLSASSTASSIIFVLIAHKVVRL